MSVRTTAPLPSTNAPLTEGERQHIAALALVRDHISKNYRAGERLPVVKGAYCGAAKAMALCLGLPMLHVATALKALNSAGEIYLCAGIHGPRVLGRKDLHPDDAALDTAVRDRLSSGHYSFGQALPTGLLGAEFGQEPDQMARALRHLVRDGLVRHDTSGPYGPGYYVTLEASGSRHADRTPQLLSAAGDR
ncbi:GntR family transcriptional regulator (plasmid) [Streptomyces sp. NBC_01278]|uniref:hypothetical protein n=1 Tax=Streptomyces sp. NBC_01278 TaxID=2903809 RepID=UPI002E326668|nr:hypothetical protein [Streptomyces sp. NBC_01278]